MDRTITVAGRGRVSIAPDMAQLAMAEAAPTPVEAGSVEVEAAVAVVFAIA